ncbi:SseB protein N-terminal domain-containing protein [Streptomyces sp. DvalAA-14]|uniref:SseB family protein n=1 Tax=unclassified Streptomyces TaxID=2593676 RepID=UPI00081B0433|nr:MULTISPECIES: SseB family protein [unclassified Streptomyces]MYS24776.1 hypothetical protein [Streptomyces sp. SID4948]SCE49272.1 SseB protein N-terminal domain-containing protein [Streptomyces sp. DvalAA-14]
MSEEAHPAEQHTGRSEARADRDTPVRARPSAESWLYSIDPGYDPDAAVPPHAVIGAWPVDPDGEPGEFVANPGYRPSQLSLLFTDPAAGPGEGGTGARGGDPAGPGLEAGVPTDPVDAAMRRAAAGHGSEAAVLDALAGTTVYLPANDAGEPTAYQDEDGPYVTVLTDPRQAPPASARLLPVGASELLGLLPDETTLWINPESEVSIEVPGARLRAALGSRGVLPGIPRKGRIGGGG